MSTTRENVARGIAMVIAFAAIVDPSIVTNRHTKPEIAFVAAVGDTTAAHLKRELARTYTIVDGPSDATQATVWSDNTMPRHAILAGPVYVVSNDAPIIERVHAPRTMHLRESTNIEVSIAPSTAKSRDVTIEIAADGHVAASATRKVEDINSATIPVVFTPSHTGVTALRITARADNAGSTTARDIAIDVRDTRIAVLVFDPSPSWQSTFVRRTLEHDARFTVTSRTSISRGIAARVGQPPADLLNAGSLAPFDAVVVGTTTGVDQASINGLDRYMRTQNGVVMILAGSAKDPALQQATGITKWQTMADPKGVRIESDSATIITGETIRPAALPPFATPVARDVDGHAVVWSMPVGGGELIINGASDAWRFRDPATSAFNAYWPGLLSAAVSNKSSAITLSSTVAAPRNEIEITTPTGNTQNSGVRASIRNETGYATSVPLIVEHLSIPDRTRLRGAFRAPSQPGTYTVSVADEAAGTSTSATATLVVTADASSIAPSPAILAAWANASGGRVIPSSRIADLRGDLRRRIPMSVQRVPWHPMRSQWWIVPFAFALAAEWYWRRRRGLP